MHGKISPSMYSGSMVGAGAMAFALMPYCIANARPDENCCVDLNPQILASIFGEPKEKVIAAIDYLCSPDPLSRSPENEGRRLALVGPGPFRYKVVNLQKYRDDAIADERREYWRQHKAWERLGKPGVFKFDVDKVWTNDECPQPVHTTGTGTDTDTSTISLKGSERFKKPTLEELKLQAAKIGLPEDQCIHFMNHYEANGWKVGKNPMRSWSHALSNWHLNYRNCTYRRPTPNGTELLTTEAKIREIQQIVKRATL